MNDVRVVFFDFGDTLVKVPPLIVWQALYRDLVRDLAGLDASLEQIRQALDKAKACLDPQLHAYHGRMDAFWRQYDQIVLEHLGLHHEQAVPLTPAIEEAFEACESKFYQLFPETREVLEAMVEQGYQLGLISNATDEVQRRLVKLELDRYFESVTYSQEVTAEKPDPKIFQVALNRMTCKSQEAVHVGNDYEADVTGAQAVGITPVLVDRNGYYPQADCLRIRNLRELLSSL